MGITPATRPKMKQPELLKRVSVVGEIDRAEYPLIAVGFRGYYLNTMGKPGINDRGLNDDAIFIDSPDGFMSFNGNTDPSRYRKGYGTADATKGMAMLQGNQICYAHILGYHRGLYLALVQRAGTVTVIRDGDPDYLDTGYFGINIHKGKVNYTNSAGCQTIHPEQWTSFITMAADLAKRYYGKGWKTHIIPYVLLEEG